MRALGAATTFLLLAITAPPPGEATGVRAVTGRSLGSPSSDLVFTPMPPCRIYDSRPGSGIQGAGTGPLAAGVVVALDVAGSAAPCGLPFGEAKAAMLNFIAVGPAGPGHLVVWPWADGPPSPPTASAINYSAVAGLNIANGVVQPICDPSTGSSCFADLFVLPGVSATHVVIDVLGWFAPPQATPLDCTNVFSSWLGPSGVGTPFSVEAVCATGYTRTGGGFKDLFGSDVRSSYPTNTAGWTCAGQGTGGLLGTGGDCYVVCCRVPGI